MSEFKAAEHFLSKGYQVYFPVVRQGKVDFVIEKEGVLQRVQVKTACINTVGKYSSLQCRVQTTNTFKENPDSGNYDLLAVVYEDSLWIIPATKISQTTITLKHWDKHKETH